MLIAHECPLMLMRESRNWTDYDYALAHLFRDNLDYYMYFAESKYLNRKIILDNGVFETEQAMELDEFADWIHMLGPTEYIIPDVLEDSKQTVDNCEQWMQHFEFKFPYVSIGVVQGRNYDDIVWCYNKLVNMVDKIAISFDYSWYEQLVITDNKYMSWMLGRQQLLHQLEEDNILVDMPHHLLGCSLPQEFTAYHNSPTLSRLIETIDTSNPVVHGINKIKYKTTGLNTKISTKSVEYMNMSYIDQEAHDIIRHNVDLFRSFCNG